MEAPAIGDVNSTAKGTGARFNAGKTPYEYLPLSLVLSLESWEDDTHPATTVLLAMGRWQAGENAALDDALAATMPTGSLPDFAAAAAVFKHVTERPVRPYPPWNWAKGMPWSVPLACAVRHALAWRSGEDLDPETGQPHVGHLQCNLLMLKHYETAYREGDDRPVAYFGKGGADG